MVSSRLHDSGGSRSIQQVAIALKGLPKSVAYFGRLALVSNEEKCNRAMLERVLGADPAVANRLVLALNSGAVIESQVSVSSVPQAIDILGIDIVRHTSLVVDLYKLISELFRSSGLSSIEFLRHAVATSSASSRLAAFQSLSASRAQTAALFHNLGIPLIACAFPIEYSSMVNLLFSASTRVVDAERDTFGFDHQEVGKLILTTFGFDPDFVLAASEHHGDPATMGPLSKCVAAGGLVAHQLGCSLGFGHAPPIANSQTLAPLGFSMSQIESTVGPVSRAMTQISSLSH